ncbi:mechanosensitive ion channel family protein [Opitutaceae bacterium]|nr:mechanosensitive ion channel family protein [Opitutaceae bacterium]
MISLFAADTETDLTLETIIARDYWDIALRVGVLLLIALPACFIVSRVIGKMSRRRVGDHLGILIQKILLYGSIIAVVITILLELGFNLGALLGAAGIMSVAIGFASQTSLSNIISGIFLYGEKPFAVGDVIKIGNTTGVVLSIDLLSVKLRQFNNEFVRIPNETMIKTEVTNVTKFPIRRLDVELGVSYSSDIDHVTKALKETADENPFSLDDPAPVIIFKGFGDSSLNFMIGAWCEKSQFLDLRNTLLRDIKNKFDSEGIEIPFPQRVVHLQGEREEDQGII